MRTLLALLLAASAVAGCLSTPTNGTPTPPSATTTPPVGTHPGGGLVIRPDHQENTSAQLSMVGDETASGFTRGGNVTFTFNVTNVGASARYSAPPPCRSERNPEISLQTEDGETLAWRPSPAMQCMLATRLVDMPNGASYESSWTWDGTVYDGTQARPAPEGGYTVTATFTAERDGAPASVSVTLNVSIVAPGVL